MAKRKPILSLEENQPSIEALVAQRLIDQEYALIDKDNNANKIPVGKLLPHLKDLDKVKELFYDERKRVFQKGVLTHQKCWEKIKEELPILGEGQDNFTSAHQGLPTIARKILIVAGFTLFFILGYTLSSTIKESRVLDASKDLDQVKKKTIERIDRLIFDQPVKRRQTK